MITFQAATAVGISIAQRVLIMPASRTTRYVGIMPPSKIMVNTNRNM